VLGVWLAGCARVRATALLVRKDLRLLRRSPALLALLLCYPLVIATLVGLVAGYANTKPRVALVDEDGLPPIVEVGGRRFHVDRTLARVSRDVTLVRLSPEAAARELSTGAIVAAVTVPPGFTADLEGMVRRPRLELATTRGGLSSRVTEQVQALVYSLNRQLQDAYIKANLGYVELIRHGGSGSFLGRRFDVLGLDGTRRLLAQLPPDPRVARIESFVRTAGLALDETDAALRATANPIQLVHVPGRGRSWLVSAQVQAYALGLTLSFLALLVAAAAFAAERDENVFGRLLRGPVTLWQLVWGKVALAAALGGALGCAIALAFGVIVQAGAVEGGEPWGRLPLLLAGIVVTGASFGALGALVGAAARDGRTASLAALLVVLPIVFVGLVPREVVPPAAWLSDAFPFAHAVRFFASTLFDASPWKTVAVETAWLAAIGLVFATLARAVAARAQSVRPVV
jgi:ABC-type Na+ efflux pump permease subunit